MSDESDLEYAGFWIRVGASLIDALLLLAITIPLAWLLVGPSYWNDTSFFKGGFGFVLDYLMPFALTLAFWLSYQATPGKMAITAKIVDARTGRAPSIVQYLVRYFGYILAALPFFVGIIWVAFDRRKQGWHDKLAGTVVIRPKRNGAEKVVFSGR
ncbi:RDD family protein [Dokdonella sp.]|uniref:RDD family protein n=1 Tax=Dokdonella sp. TaxID=2291710 RepID=UPI003529BABC